VERRQERVNILLVGEGETNVLTGLFHVLHVIESVEDFTVKILIRIDNSQLSVKRTISANLTIKYGSFHLITACIKINVSFKINSDSPFTNTPTRIFMNWAQSMKFPQFRTLLSFHRIGVWSDYTANSQQVCLFYRWKTIHGYASRLIFAFSAFC